MASGRLVDYLASGVIADRPASLDLAAGSVGLWFATDTGVLSAWDGSAWADVGGGGGGISAINEQTGTSYTLVIGDATKAVRCTDASAVALTIPPHSSVALPLLCTIPAFQGGAGPVTITAGAGVTLESPNGVDTAGVGDFRTLFQRATDVWVIG